MSIENNEPTFSEGEMNLNRLHSIVQENLKIYDENLLDTLLAVYLSNNQPDDPLWLFVVGQPSSSKSVLMAVLEGLEDYYPLGKFTPNTLSSGYRGYPGLAPELKDKVVCMNDMAPILTMNSQAKLEIWGQLRELYDGIVRDNKGNGADIKYEDIFITFIANATPAIDSQRSIFSQLGSRELMYRLSDRTYEDNQQIINNLHSAGYSTQRIKKNLKNATATYFNQLKPIDIKFELTTYEFLHKIAWFISNMRASGTYDSYTGELISEVVKEEPIRVFKMMQKLLKCLLMLDIDYPMEKAQQILKRIAVSSCQPNRIKILQILSSCNPLQEEYSSSEIATMCKMGTKSILSQLWTLFSLNLVSMKKDETISYKPTYHWKIRDEGRKIYSLLRIDKL